MKFQLVVLLASISSAIAASCGCGNRDLTCIVKCLGLPDPTEDQAIGTQNCNAECTTSGGGDSCFEACVKKIYLDYQKDTTKISDKPTTKSETKSETKTTETKSTPTSTSTSEKSSETKSSESKSSSESSKSESSKSESSKSESSKASSSSRSSSTSTKPKPSDPGSSASILASSMMLLPLAVAAYFQ
ncbi:hypothetical protein K502DRAFT_368125 [Neoconidiobolus thromboides FSU 785]|nr:hypothetical protein K502DRAFT_368125 [Neoconidiobolus thromboides FSU 785]